MGTKDPGAALTARGVINLRMSEIDMGEFNPTKTCTKCLIEKPLGEFRNNTRRPGFTVARCKECESAWHRAHYEANREKVAERGRRWYAENSERRAVSRKAYYRANREVFAENQRRWNAANPDRRAELSRQWRIANADRLREWTREYRDANREHLQEAGRAAYARNPEKYIERAARRRAMTAGSAVGPVDLESLWTDSCGICGHALDREVCYPDPMSKSLDHIVPLSRGGAHEQSNLQWAHLFCDVSKGARMPE